MVRITLFLKPDSMLSKGGKDAKDLILSQKSGYWLSLVGGWKLWSGWGHLRGRIGFLGYCNVLFLDLDFSYMLTL